MVFVYNTHIADLIPQVVVPFLIPRFQKDHPLFNNLRKNQCAACIAV
jgi:hypothetical protein